MVTSTVKACLAAGAPDSPAQPLLHIDLPVETEEDGRPFLTVVMRTQGKRCAALAQALLCLEGQIDQDFEVQLVVHNASEPALAGVQAVVDQLPTWLQSKVHLTQLTGGGRAVPLNHGFAAAAGRYICAFDDDDIVCGSWVSTFHGLEQANPGTMLRAVCLTQDSDEVTVAGQPVPAGFGEPRYSFPTSFNAVEHIVGNRTPNLSIAFPRALFHDLGLRFDESLSTTEDWDFLLRAALICPVSSSERVTSIYRWWLHAESSRALHDGWEWEENARRIHGRIATSALILPAGSSTDIIDVYQRREELETIVMEQQGILAEVQDRLKSVHEELARLEKARERVSAREAELQDEAVRFERMMQVVAILNSRSWRLTAPLRFLARLIHRRRAVQLGDLTRLSSGELAEILVAVQNSRSLRLLRKLRARG